MIPDSQKRGRRLRTKIALYLLWLLVLSITAGTSSPNASSDLERETLARLLAELQVLHRIVDKSEQAARKNDRQRFSYQALRRDLVMIATGINDHLHMSRRDPQTLPPLRGNYHP